MAESRRTAAVGPRAGRVPIELSQTQVNAVIRAASRSGHWSALMLGLCGERESLEAALGRLDDTRLSRSLLTGLLLLAVFPRDGGDLGVADLARMLAMSNSTVHRYVSTLVEAGLLERDPSTRRYSLAHAA